MKMLHMSDQFSVGGVQRLLGDILDTWNILIKGDIIW